MLAFFCLFQQTLSWQTIDVHRFIQYTANSTNTAQRGSTRVNVDSSIATIDAKPDSKQAIFIDLEDIDIKKLEEHINVSSPIIVSVPDKEVDTKELESFLLSGAHKAPIYFKYGHHDSYKKYSHVKTKTNPSNSQNKKVRLQNVHGAINASKTYERERIAIITAPYDSFSTVPSAKTGANVNGLSLAALLESMRLASKFPITNNWCFIFAVLDGHFCNYEGLERFLSSISAQHSSKIEFAISLEEISAPKLKGHFSMKLIRDSSFAKFMHCLKDAFNQTGIPFSNELSEEKHEQTVFGQRFMKSISITSDDEDADELSRITDTKPDYERANAVAWAVSEALLRMMYGADISATMVERSSVNASYWARAVTIPRMPTVRDRAFINTIGQYMKNFGKVQYDDWSSTKCPAVYQATDATLILYNQMPFKYSLGLFTASIVYGFVILVVIARDKLFKLFL
jgi:hypothetical protein